MGTRLGGQCEWSEGCELQSVRTVDDAALCDGHADVTLFKKRVVQAWTIKQPFTQEELDELPE